MKVLVVLVLTLVAVLGEAKPPTYRYPAKSISYRVKKVYYAIYQTCIKESKIGRSHLEDYAESGDLPDDPSLKRFFSCLLQRTGSMDQSGEFRLREGSKERMTEYVGDKETVERIVNECMVKRGSAEESAMEFLRCKKRIYSDYMLGFTGRVPDDLYAKWKLYKFECATGDTLDHLNSGTFPDTPEFKDYILCISKKFGFQNATGHLSRDQILNATSEIFWRPSRVVKLGEKCLSEEETPRDTAFLIMRCYYDNTFMIYDRTVPEEFVGAHESCRNESKIAFEQIQEAKGGGYPDEPEFKEHLLCMYRKVGIIDRDGVVKKVPLVVKYGKFREVQIVEDAVNRCDHVGKTQRDTAYELFVCLNKNLRDVCNVFKYF